MTKQDLEETCRDCKEHHFVPTGKNNDYCIIKAKFIRNYKKPCKKFTHILMGYRKDRK